MLPGHLQGCVMRNFGWLAAILLAGTALAVQPNAAPGMSGKDQKQSLRQVADSADVRITVLEPRASSSLVTVEELQHTVPAKARGEAEKAEESRLEHRTEDAIVHFNRAILIDPEFAAARNNLAALLMPTDPALAAAHLQEAVKMDPRNPMVLINLTLSYVLLHNWEAAEQAARLAVGLDRTDGYARLLLGIVLVDERKFTDEALRCFTQARAEHPLAHLLAGRVLMVQGDSEGAKSELQQYLASGDQKNRAVATLWLDFMNQNDQTLAKVLPQ